MYLIDTFRAEKIPEYPFQCPLPTADIPLELNAELNSFELLYNELYRLKIANPFKKSYINFAILLNKLLDTPVLSFISDDDEYDFACTVSSRQVTRIIARCEDLVISLRNGRPHIQPLVPEYEDDEELLTDLSSIKSNVPDAIIAERNVDWPSGLHTLAIQEWQLFSGSKTTVLGLGSFDPPEDETDWKLVAIR